MQIDKWKEIISLWLHFLVPISSRSKTNKNKNFWYCKKEKAVFTEKAMKS